jgi:hypothetical protein
MREIVDLSWNAESFVSNVEKALTVTTELDQKLKDVAADTNKINFSKPISEVSKLKEVLSAGADMKGFEDIFKEFDKNIPKIKAYLVELKKAMANATNPQEIQALNKVISQTEKAIAEVTNETKTFEKSQVSLRAEIRKNTVELQQLEKQGKQNTKEYKALRDETAGLIDSQKDLQGALKGLSSDTYKVDLGVEGIQMGIAGYQTYLGVMALVGEESKELQEAMTKLLAIQQVAQGVQQISTFLTNKEGLALELKTKWTALTTMATNAATTAQGRFNLVLAASGIGLTVVALGLLVANWEKVTAALTGVTTEQQKYNEALKGGIDAGVEAQEEVIKVGIAFEQARKGTISKTQALEIYNETLGDNLGLASSLEQAETIYAQKTDAYVQASIRRAAAQQLIESAAKKRIDSELNNEIDLVDRYNTLFTRILIGNKETDKILKAEKKAEKEKEIQSDIDLAKKFLTEEQQLISQFKLISESNKSKDTEKRTKSTKENEKKVFTELGKVQDEEYLKLIEKAKGYYNDLEKLTETQSDELNKLRISNILDSGARENAALDNAFDIQKRSLDKAIEENKQSLLDYATINPEKYDEVLIQIENFQTIANQIRVEYEIDYQNKRLELNKKALQDIITQTQEFGQLQQSELDKNLSEEVLILTEKYSQNLINKEQYEKELANIEARYQKAKGDKRIESIQKEIEDTEDLLNADPDNAKLQERLNKLIEEANKIKTEALKGDNVKQGDTIFGKIFGLDPTSATFNEDKQKILDGLKSMVQSSIDILREQTRAEIEAYDTAIRLQQERVNQAQKIADNGNAEYLQMEEERLKEVEQKREEAARRQLEIDAALQASQMLVAIAGAAAQIAQGGVANVIAGIGSIAAVAAAGFALLNQLNASRPTFYTGTEGTVAEELGRPQRAGKDGYDISVDGQEMILKPSISKQLRAKGVKSSDLPMLVALGQNRVNEVGYNIAKVEAVNTLGGLESRLDRQEKVQKQLLKSFDNFKVSMNVDEAGVAMIVSSQNLQKQKSNKA